MEKALSLNEQEFYREAILIMTSSLNMAKSMKDCFDYLSKHFPIDGISLHQFDPVLRGHKLFFLVTKDGFHHVERFIPFSDELVDRMQRLENDNEAFIDFPDDSTRMVGRLHGQAVANLLPYKERSYMVRVIWTGQKVLGHLIFMGKSKGCFTQEHFAKQSLLLPHFSVAMANMMQYQRAMDFQKKLDRRQQELEAEIRALRERSIIGTNSGLKQVMDMVSQLSDSEAPVLITGETGTGKEVIADAIQNMSPRRGSAFVKVNCGAIPEALVDSELFGYVKGAFTGAAANRSGRFEQANNGTIFLDEIGEFPLSSQVRLLRVLQNGVVERLGSDNPIAVNVRIIAATNRNLETMLRNRTFREDLYYRLNVFPVHIPPLRERKEDIMPLASYFVKKICDKTKRSHEPRISLESFERMMAYTWPGNVRELANLIERTMILCNGEELHPEVLLPQDPGWYLNGDGITEKDYFQNLVAELVAKELESRLGGEKPHTTGGASDFKTLDALIKEHIQAALLACGGQIHGAKGAGNLLGINPNTLRKKMQKLGISLKTRPVLNE